MTKLRRLVLRGILKNQKNEFLLLQRSRKSLSWPDLWEFPGGKVDSGEDLTNAIKREFREETGLDVEIVHLFEAFEWPREQDTIVYLIYLVKGEGIVTISAEHESFRWCALKEIKTLSVSPPLKSVIEKLSTIY